MDFRHEPRACCDRERLEAELNETALLVQRSGGGIALRHGKLHRPGCWARLKRVRRIEPHTARLQLVVWRDQYGDGYRLRSQTRPTTPNCYAMPLLFILSAASNAMCVRHDHRTLERNNIPGYLRITAAGAGRGRARRARPPHRRATPAACRLAALPILAQRDRFRRRPSPRAEHIRRRRRYARH